ncbi:hypothetical protein ACIOZM_08475 [Pseudomonas sp. NPDC087346]|uniref:hypothetical protein n=1 Tax=Pseudomonas sp. NPDC087346 TaxID=3364438 RepID=UPI0037F49EDA
MPERLMPALAAFERAHIHDLASRLVLMSAFVFDGAVRRAEPEPFQSPGYQSCAVHRHGPL